MVKIYIMIYLFVHLRVKLFIQLGGQKTIRNKN